MPRAPKRIAPEETRFFHGSVVRTARISERFQRVTVAGDDLTRFPWLGFDHWFRLFLPWPEQTTFRLPTATDSLWWPQYLTIPTAERPHCANYTVADFRPGSGELDIDFVLHYDAHGDIEGRAAGWALGAHPGDVVAILDQGRMFAPPAEVSEYLIAADETGVPAVLSILRSLPSDARGRVALEIPTASDRRESPAPADLDVSWFVRDDAVASRGDRVLDAIDEWGEADPTSYAFIVGESRLATRGRKILRARGLPTERITFSGFWKAA